MTEKTSGAKSSITLRRVLPIAAVLLVFALVFVTPAAADAKIGETSYATLQEAITAAGDGATITLSGGTYTMPTSLENKDITFTGGKGAVINVPDIVPGNGQPEYGASNSDLTFIGVTVQFDNNDYNGFAHANKVVYQNCNLTGQQFMYAPTVEFTNCIFDGNQGKDIYYVWTYGAKEVTFTNCIFYTGGKAILVYTESAHKAAIALYNCAFYSDGSTATNKAAVEVGQSANGNKATYDITFEGCTTDGNFYANNSPSPLIGNKNDMDSEGIKSTIDNEPIVVTEMPVVESARVGQIDANKAKVTFILEDTVEATGYKIVITDADGTITKEVEENVRIVAGGRKEIEVEGLTPGVTYTVTITPLNSGINRNAIDYTISYTQLKLDFSYDFGTGTTENIIYNTNANLVLDFAKNSEGSAEPQSWDITITVTKNDESVSGLTYTLKNAGDFSSSGSPTGAPNNFNIVSSGSALPTDSLFTFEVGKFQEIGTYRINVEIVSSVVTGGTPIKLTWSNYQDVVVSDWLIEPSNNIRIGSADDVWSFETPVWAKFVVANPKVSQFTSTLSDELDKRGQYPLSLMKSGTVTITAINGDDKRDALTGTELFVKNGKIVMNIADGDLNYAEKFIIEFNGNRVGDVVDTGNEAKPVDYDDSLYILNLWAEKNYITPGYEVYADVDNSGKVDTDDAMYVFDVGLGKTPMNGAVLVDERLPALTVTV